MKNKITMMTGYNSSSTDRNAGISLTRKFCMSNTRWTKQSPSFVLLFCRLLLWSCLFLIILTNHSLFGFSNVTLLFLYLSLYFICDVAKKSLVSRTVLTCPRQDLHNKEEDLTKSTDVVLAKYPSKVKLENFHNPRVLELG